MSRQPNLSDAARALGRKGGRIGGRARGPCKSRVSSPRYRPLTPEDRARGVRARRVKATLAWLREAGDDDALRKRALALVLDRWGEDILREALSREEE